MTTTSARTPILTGLAVDRAMRNYAAARTTGHRLAWAREAAGVSQRELAAYIGISKTTIGRVEHGERVLRPEERLAVIRTLGCSLATLTAPAIALPPASSNGNGNGHTPAAIT